MEVHFQPELEAEVDAFRSPAEAAMLKNRCGRFLTRHFEEETRIVEAVSLGEEALQLGEYLTHDPSWPAVSPVLRP